MTQLEKYRLGVKFITGSPERMNEKNARIVNSLRVGCLINGYTDEQIRKTFKEAIWGADYELQKLSEETRERSTRQLCFTECFNPEKSENNITDNEPVD